MTASTSSSRMTRISPALARSLNSSPAQEVNRTLSPSFTWRPRRLPSFKSLPGPAARMVPFCGLFLALYDNTMPPALASSADSRRTTIRSPRGLIFMLLSQP